MKIENEDLYREFYNSGKMMYYWPKHNGKFHGKQYSWYENGKLAQEYHQLNDSWNGLYKKYDLDGSYCFLKQYKNNQEHGPKILFIYFQQKETK